MNPRELAQLIHSFRKGRATKAQQEKLEHFWENAATDKSFINSLSTGEKEALKKQMYQSIKQQAGIGHTSNSKRSIQLWAYRAAAVIAVFALAFVGYLSLQDTLHEIHTNYGERLTVTLPDASSVVLNGNSTVRYADNWSESAPREVWIDGEGFFEIKHTKNHQKFIVHTNEGLDVEVLGTKFNVKSRQRGTEVLLTEGKVKLNVKDSNEKPVYLTPGELATIKKDQLSKQHVQKKKYTSWVERKLYFDKTPLIDLAHILEDTYGMEVYFEAEDLKERQLSGEISSATSDDILLAIAETFNVEVVRKGNKITLSSRE